MTDFCAPTHVSFYYYYLKFIFICVSTVGIPTSSVPALLFVCLYVNFLRSCLLFALVCVCVCVCVCVRVCVCTACMYTNFVVYFSFFFHCCCCYCFCSGFADLLTAHKVRVRVVWFRVSMWFTSHHTCATHALTHPIALTHALHHKPLDPGRTLTPLSLSIYTYMYISGGTRLNCNHTHTRVGWLVGHSLDRVVGTIE